MTSVTTNVDPASAREVIFPLPAGLDAHALHKAVHDFFPAGPRAFLYRPTPTPRSTIVLLRGDLAGSPFAGGGTSLIEPQMGEILSFSLRARPERRPRQGKPGQEKLGQENPGQEKPRKSAGRQGFDFDEIGAMWWLNQRAAARGFEILASQVDRWETIVIDKGTGAPRFRQTLAHFSGRLKVSDADLLRRSLMRPYGRAVTYGCGLLDIRRD